VPSATPIVPSLPVIDVFVKKKKCFVRKYKSDDNKHACTDKFHKLGKNHKFNKSNKIMGILHTKSNLRFTNFNIKGVITLDPNTMKSNAMASSSSPCPSSSEAMIPKSIFHGH
jgi:hypothetical protein